MLNVANCVWLGALYWTDGHEAEKHYCRSMVGDGYVLWWMNFDFFHMLWIVVAWKLRGVGLLWIYCKNFVTWNSLNTYKIILRKPDFLTVTEHCDRHARKFTTWLMCVHYIMCLVYKSVAVLFPTADLKANTQNIRTLIQYSCQYIW